MGGQGGEEGGGVGAPYAVCGFIGGEEGDGPVDETEGLAGGSAQACCQLGGEVGSGLRHFRGCLRFGRSKCGGRCH